MNVGTLDKKIKIIAFEEIENKLGFKELNPNNKLTCWARIEPLRGKEYYEAQKNKTENGYKITTRYHKNINDSMLIEYQSRTFEIQNIVDPYMNHSKLEFYCVEKGRGEGVAT